MPYPSLTRPHRLRSSLRAIASAAVVVASALSLAPSASAAEYHLYTCHRPEGPLVTSSEDWKAASRGKAALPSVNCLRDALMYWNLGTSNTAAGDFSGVGLTLPDGLKATFIIGERWVGLHPGDDSQASITYELVAGQGWDGGDPDMLERCSLAAGCTGWDSWYGVRNSTIGTSITPPASFVGFKVSCKVEVWGACGGGSNARGHVRINRLDLTIDDPFAPQAATPTGTLVQDGPRSGNESLSVAATDRGSGVYLGSVVIDGKEVSVDHPDDVPSCNDIGPDPSRWEFDRVQPCPVSTQLVFPIETTKFADGGHRLEVWVRDAAGNRTKAYEKNITIDNVPPPSVGIKPSITGSTLTDLRPSDALAAQNGTWVGNGIAFSQRWQRSTAAGTWVDIPNGTGVTYRVGSDDIGQQLRVVVTAKNADGSTEAASEPTGKVKTGATGVVANAPTGPVAVGSGGSDTNGAGGNPATGQLVVDREQRTVDVKHGAKVVITGRLVDADGNPIAGASVDIYEQIAVTAAPWTKVDTVKTDVQGGYVYRPKTTSSRRLRFGFSELRGGAAYRATREVFVSITAGMTIAARSKIVPRRGLIRIGGQVIVDRLPSGGAVVEVQVLDAGIWRTVATRRANKDGKWSFKHRLRGASATRFTFRSRLRAAGDLPSAEAKSAPLKVRVR